MSTSIQHKRVQLTRILGSSAMGTVVLFVLLLFQNMRNSVKQDKYIQTKIEETTELMVSADGKQDGFSYSLFIADELHVIAAMEWTRHGGCLSVLCLSTCEL